MAGQGYRAPICRGWPAELDGEAPGTIRDFAGFQCWSGEFSETLAYLRQHCAKVANANFLVLRDNVICSTAEFQANLAAAQAHSTATRNHIGNFVAELRRLGVYYKPTMFDRAWGIERSAAVDAAAVAAGAPIFGVASLCSYVHGTTDTGFTGSSRASLRRILYAIAIYCDGGTFSIGASGTKPGPNRSNAATDAFIDALWAFIIPDTTDILTRMGWYADPSFIIPQLFNGGENTRGIRRVGYQSYFSNATYDLKNPNVVTALAGLYPGMVVPTAATEGTALAMQDLMDERAEWCNKIFQEVSYGAIDADNVVEDMQSVHIYGSGGAEPRVCGDPDVTKAPIVGEFNISKPFDPREHPRSGDSHRSASDVANNPLNDNDEACFLWLPVGEEVDVWLETNPQIVATIPADPTTQEVIDALCSLPGIGDPKSATDGTRDIEVINSYNNTLTPASIWYYPPDGRVFNGFRMYMGHRRDAAGALPDLADPTDTNNSVSKAAKMPRFVLDHAHAYMFKTMRGGAIDRGPYMQEMLVRLHERGYRGFTYHTPLDPRSGRAADQRHFWSVAGYEAWLAAGRTRSIHDGGPHMAEEPKLYKWFWSLFPRTVNQWWRDRQ